jgi:hypothetical protein
MPFISTKTVKERRDLLKKALPEFKISVKTVHYSTISVTILSGPFDLLPNSVEKYEQVNKFYIDDHYADLPETKDVLKKVLDIANKGNYIESEDGDYGSIPSFYTRISIGKWDRPYQVIKK